MLTPRRNVDRASSRWKLATASVFTAIYMGGCATPPPVMDPFSGLREARTRAEVEKQASRDPFPSPSDVGLK